MIKVDKLERIMNILKTEYGIESREDFEIAVRDFQGINLGVFTAPLPERRNQSESQKEMATA